MLTSLALVSWGEKGLLIPPCPPLPHNHESLLVQKAKFAFFLYHCLKEYTVLSKQVWTFRIYLYLYKH